ncbi:MAG: small multi-drug export protein [Spirochaetota bacterium]
MNVHTFFVAALLSLLPISELRGAIPYAIAKGVPVLAAYLFCVILNALVGPIVYIFLSTLHRLLSKIPLYRRLFDKIVQRARLKVGKQVNKFGYIGIMLFVAVPLPVTGAYTGTLGAWILGLNAKKTCLVVAAGVCIAGIIVTLVSVLGIEALSLFVKKTF